MANDLLDSVIEQLRATPAVVSAFGDTWVPNPTPTATNLGTGTIKFWADFAGNFTLPYLVLFEVDETYQYMTEAPASPPTYSYLADGRIACSIFQSSRYAARQLGILVAAALNDAAITWTGGTLMMQRMGSAAFVPIKDVGPGVSQVFNRIITFNYEYSGTIS